MLWQVAQSHLLKWPMNDIEEISQGYAGTEEVVPDIPHSGDNNAQDSCERSTDIPPMPVIIPEGRKTNMYKPRELLLLDSMLETLSIDLQILHAHVVDKSKTVNMDTRPR